MLRIKYFESFKNAESLLVVIADREALRAAFEYFSKSTGAFLNDAAVAEFSDVAPLTRSHLYLNKNECAGIAQHFKTLYEINEPRHTYFDTAALSDAVEILISFGEYEELF